MLHILTMTRLSALRSAIVPMGFGTVPAMAVAVLTAGVGTTPFVSLVRILAAGVVVAGVGYWLARRWLDSVRASNAVALPLAMSCLYPAAQSAFRSQSTLPEVWFSIPYLLLCLVAAWAMSRTRARVATAVHEALSIAAAVLLLLAIVTLSRTYLGVYVTDEATRAAVERLTAPLPGSTGRASGTSSASVLPDVFHLLLDGMSRPRSLEREFGVSIAQSLAELRSLGFEVREDAGSANYTQTNLSLASMLNMTYLDELLEVRRTSLDRRPLQAMVANSRVPSLFKELGYSVHFIGSGFVANGILVAADRCDCPQIVFGNEEILAISATPIESVLMLPIFYRPLYRRAMDVFEQFEQSVPADAGQRPRYAFAHVPMPHPPFIVNADGDFAPPLRRPGDGDGTFFPGSDEDYRVGYRAQASFVLWRTLKAVRHMLEEARAAGRDLLIVISGDHGARLGYDFRRADAVAGASALHTFIAIRWPDATGPKGVPRSLVNIYRTVFREAFGIPFEPLNDKGYVSAFTSPYDVRRVEGLTRSPADAAGAHH